MFVTSFVLQLNLYFVYFRGLSPTYENHDKVSKINTALKDRSLKTWFDEDRMEAESIDDQMISGIDNAEVILVFITERYIEKVGGSNQGDNCKKEFNYAQLHQKKMIAVVMEEACYDKKKMDWCCWYVSW